MFWSSCRVLGASWGPLGRLKSFWTPCGRVLGQTYVPKGGQDGAQMGAKVCQNRRQNGPKSKQKLRRKKKLLKIVLEPSWVDLGSSWVPPEGQNRAVAHTALVFLKIDVLKKSGLKRRLGPILGRFGSPKRGQNEGRGGSKKELC